MSQSESELFFSSLSLSKEILSPHPLEVISTALPFLIIPFKSGLERVRISCDNLQDQQVMHGTKFVYILDTANLEGRTCDNLGKLEDIATGSEVGPAAAFLCKHGFVNGTEAFSIRQGGFVGRNSEMLLKLDVDNGEISNILVSGNVFKMTGSQIFVMLLEKSTCW